jgi:DNA-binding beta-propeller fold protein YncE
MENWAVTVITEVGDHIIGMMTTADGKFLYANDGEGSRTYKIDLALNKVVASTSASVAGPYGMALTWDEKLLYLVGKGEGAANQGHVLGVIDTTTFRPASSTLLGVNQPIELGGNSRTVDHAQLHPDPKVNELWISNMGGPETTVLDLKTNKVIAHIPTPHLGNTHSGAFIKYNADWTATVLADHGGPKKDMLTTRAAMAKAAAVTPTAVPATATPVPAPR